MLFKLSVRNLTRSVKDYAIYFFTLIIGVAIFYVFNAIESQTVMMNVNTDTRELIKLMNSMLSGVSVFVSFVLGFLIIYASRFLMKRRSREFAIYLLLGMGKRRISVILFLETLMIGLVSLAAGLLVGVGLSQLMSILVANLFEADMTEFAFVFSGSACSRTILYFGVMYIVVILFQTVSINRCKLIELIQSGRRSEEVKMKNPWLCIVVFVLAAAVLGYAYRMVTTDFNTLQSANMILVPIALGCVSTFFIFWSLSGLLLKLMQARKRVYYRGLNSFILRQISSKVNTTVFSMSVICIMLFVTICVLSSALSIRNSMRANLDALAPAELELTKLVNVDEEVMRANDYSEEQIKNQNLSILETLSRNGFDLEPQLSEYVVFYTYKTNELTLGDTLGGRLDEIMEQYRFMAYSQREDIMKLSEYNQVAQLYGRQTYELEDNEYMIVADFQSMVAIRNQALASGETITVFGKTFAPRYTSCQDGFIELSSNRINSGLILLPDAAVDESFCYREYLVGNYNLESREQKEQLEEQLTELARQPGAKDYIFPRGTSRLEIAEASIGLGAMVTFIGLYLGVVFLISSAAILALKELSESVDNVQRYQLLQKLGADEKMLNRAIFSQIGIFFLFPLVLAVIHSIFGMKFSMIILETFGTGQMFESILMTAGILAVIYGGYFIITYVSSKNISNSY